MSYVIEKSWNKVEEIIYPIFQHNAMEFFLGLLVFKAISSFLLYSQDSWDVCNNDGWCKDLAQTFNDLFLFVLNGFSLAFYFQLTYRAIKMSKTLRPMSFMPIVAIAILTKFVIYLWSTFKLCTRPPNDFNQPISGLTKFLECEVFEDVNVFNAVISDRYSNQYVTYSILAGLVAGVV